MTFCNRIVKDVWPGRDNDFRLLLERRPVASPSTPYDLVDVSKVDLVVAGETLSVNRFDAQAPINWWSVELSVGEMQFRLGDFVQSAAIPGGMYPAELVLYTPDYPDGLVWISSVSRDLMIYVLD